MALRPNDFLSDILTLSLQMLLLEILDANPQNYLKFVQEATTLEACVCQVDETLHQSIF